MIVDILKRLSYNRIMRIGFIVFGTVIAPYMFIFQFAPHIFSQTSLLPLVFLSFCVGLPITLVLLLLQILNYAALDPVDPKEKLENRFSQMSTSSIMVAVGFYIPCCIKFFDQSLVLREAVTYMSPFFFAIIISSVISIFTGSTKRLHDELLKKSEEQKIKNK